MRLHVADDHIHSMLQQFPRFLQHAVGFAYSRCQANIQLKAPLLRLLQKAQEALR
ncbi:hypothetical protein [Pontibacter sp. H249]|uniref:hypothetical protein n=1 Tax=Pontibacter sp. H249 TaxID=3133420 RepID=UPI0030BC18AE